MGGLNKWELYRLPVDMTGVSFIDVGCWEGHRCVDAVLRGVARVVGVDLCTSGELRRNMAEHVFEFVQADILSERFLGLDCFDIVLCSGVLYHVQDVIGLLVRLRKVAAKRLVLETVVNTLDPDVPLLRFHADDELAGNPSNWWTPNELCLHQMLEVCGFSDCESVYRSPAPENSERVCIHATPVGAIGYEKMMPRKKELMSVFGGDRVARPQLIPKEPVRTPTSDS